MRLIPVLFLFVTILQTRATAQQEWVDYILGRPDMYAIEARRDVAKEWGIRYRAITAGDVLTDKLRKEASRYDEQNKPYLQVLAHRYGSDWQIHFNRDVKKRHFKLIQTVSPREGTWYELITGRPDMHYFNTKKAVAKSWGINYEPLFVSPGLTGAAKDEAEAKTTQSYDYEVQLNQFFGENWKAWLTEETEWQLAKERTPKDYTWKDPVWGQPDTTYFNAKSAVAADWGIVYEPRFLGSTRDSRATVTQYLKNNGRYFQALYQHFGADWPTTFYREVSKAFWNRKLEE